MKNNTGVLKLLKRVGVLSLPGWRPCPATSTMTPFNCPTGSVNAVDLGAMALSVTGILSGYGSGSQSVARAKSQPSEKVTFFTNNSR